MITGIIFVSNLWGLRLDKNKKNKVNRPTDNVVRLVSTTLKDRELNKSIMLSPWLLMPNMCLTWLNAIIMPEAVMNPDITGCDNKLAINPKRIIPIRIRNVPDRKAKLTATVIGLTV